VLFLKDRRLDRIIDLSVTEEHTGEPHQASQKNEQDNKTYSKSDMMVHLRFSASGKTTERGP